ncbi:CRISPR-associated helicase Cas3' [Allofranklinella schreckenbergeri]|uniref:CRISPR-associated helicase Cas3 n=1 Tax=Allofranklinella schreckenbergeri TaxID=1076744 RepID=A0A3M6Q907_9BURK|nr:CRISPR-associated helicase Cas3' [Allofranklinella schreckenbergeri]RMW99663.1 CRISPR-associated helicase Cas3' [Allofranklinella schreckenbergeri]
MLKEQYFAYWGKAMPRPGGDAAYHLLPFHALDVAACGQRLLALPHFSLQSLADELGWPRQQAESVFLWFLALHDLGKFARSFQGLRPDLSPDLVDCEDAPPYRRRHDTLGWWLWRELAEASRLPIGLAPVDQDFWAVWMRCVSGHHGQPPLETAGGGLLQADTGDDFFPSDRRAALAFIDAITPLFLGADKALPRPATGALSILRRHAWHLAGLAVLADWLGSNQDHFPYRSAPLALADYWDMAQAQAARAVTEAGLAGAAVRHWSLPQRLFDYLHTPTPLQDYAACVPLQHGPQLFVLEDVTGAGKTEAALMLAQRLMQAGQADGLYFALPSMATANQMYQRVGQVYRRLYAQEAMPSLVLAHGARQLLADFRHSVLQPREQAEDGRYAPDERSASLQCNAWLADHRKKALLAEVGVGTLDQALLAVLPARHQSLRLLGLCGKVLLIDEVHAYDPYMMALLQTLLSAHASQGGSAILLSATLPLGTRDALLAAWHRGLKLPTPLPVSDMRYPLTIQAGRALHVQACATRPQLRRHVQVRLHHSEEAVLALIVEQARAGYCVAWIRNTVDDARRAFQQLGAQLPAEKLHLFHSRYAMGDRLDIEVDVLARFGKASGDAQRCGRVLIGTQVLEQSLDFDVDVMVSDLAPIDLLIQRAGRLQRHARQANGDLAADGIEQRPPPVLHLLSPEPVDAPSADWYAALFPKARHVYPDSGKLWLGARALQAAGGITTPGELGQASAVRSLVEAVYGAADEAIPEALRKAFSDQIGKDLAMHSQARFNALDLAKGYCMDSSARWYEDDQVPTRLGDETLTVYLARWHAGALQPLRAGDPHAWEQSAVRIHAHRAKALAPDWQQRFGRAIEALRQQCRLLESPAFILPLLDEGQGLHARVIDNDGHARLMRYDRQAGLQW